MKLQRLFFSALLCITAAFLLLLATPTQVQAATEGYYTYEVMNREATITDVSTSISGDVVIPSTLGGYPVTSIGNSAFYDCDSLTSITIPDSVTSIGYHAFYWCDSLTSITIPDTVTSIGNGAFDYCHSLSYTVYDNGKYLGNADNPYVAFMDTVSDTITSCTIHNNTKCIGNSAFYGCDSLASITIPDSVTSIGDDAFYSCNSLTSITIPDSVTSIGNSAFYWCSSLTGIWVDENNQHYASDTSGVLFNKEMTTLIQAPRRLNGMYAIPASVTSIGNSAFCDCTSLTSITIPDSVTSIGNSAFSWCDSLTSITIPDSVTSISANAFHECDSLTSITIPDSVTSIGNSAFSWCDSLNTVYYSSGQSQWSQIFISSGNSDLTSATIHYNHVHDYTVLPVTTVEASCTADGYREYTCVYGETYRETIPMLAHTTGNDAVVTPPTCEAKGYTTSTCPNCKQVVQTEFVGALGHDYRGTVTVVPPSCTEQGYTGTQCTRCDSVSKTKFVDALDHDYNGTVTVVPPKCTEEGYTLTQCIRCDSIQKSDITQSSGHKMVAVPAVEATCTKVGLTVGTACERCGMPGVVQTETPSLGHNYIENICATCEHKFGDVDYNEVINVDDALLLLLYVCMPEKYELDADLDGNGDVDACDVSILLLHVSMPDQFPLQPAKKEEL